MKKILVLPLLLCLIFCSFLSLDKIWTNLILTAQHTVHTITGLSGALMPLLIRPRFHSRKSWTHAQCFIQSQICRHSWIASIQKKYLLSCSHMPHPYLFAWFLGRLTSNLSWLGALLQLIHIILFAYAAIVVMRICLTNTSRRFIIRFIHDKDGHKLISFADYFKTRAYAEEI